MDDIGLKQNTDFMSIAIECIETGSHDVAIEFIEDVAAALDDESRVATLERAIQSIEEGDIDEAYDQAVQVNEELLQDIDAL